MQKNIYILILFFSFSAFASDFNEYDPGNGNYGSPYIHSGAGTNNGTGFWSTNVSREVATVSAMGTNAYLYMKQPPTKDLYKDPEVVRISDDGWEDAKSILEYQYKSGDVIEYIPLLWDHQEVIGGPVIKGDFKRDSNGNIQFAYIISNNNQSTFQQTPPTYTPMEVNANMMNTFVSESTRPYFSYNVYNVNTNSFSENIYKATTTGPVIVRSRELKPYSNIPRVVKENPNFAPGSPFSIGGSIYSGSATANNSLFDGYRMIRDYLDYTSPDDVLPSNNGIGLREKRILDVVVPRIREGLPEGLKSSAELILSKYIENCDKNPNTHPALIMNNLLILYSQALTENPTMTGEQFENWFMGVPEGLDDTYNAAFWENTNLIVPKQDLPSLASFADALPKKSDGKYMTGADLYPFVGGEVYQAYLDFPTIVRGSCALKISYGLNHGGIEIGEYIDEKGKPQTLKGKDGKYYFVNAHALNSWMRLTFGTKPATAKTPYNENHRHFTAADGGAKGIKFTKLVEGMRGIYSMVTPLDKHNTWGSGHSDFLYDTKCLTGGNCYFYDIKNNFVPVDFIDIWILK